MIVNSYSWTVIDKKTAVKKMDMSVFKNNGSGVPVKIRFFFDIDKFEAGDNRPVTLELDGIKYEGRLERIRSTARQTRLMWEKKLTVKFNKMYPKALSTKEYPEMIITKKDKSHYVLSFDAYDDTGTTADDYRDDYLESVVKAGPEGKRVQYYTTKYERKGAYRKAAIDYHKAKCGICGFDFEKVYGERGKGFIEVHHIKPLYSLDGEVDIDPKKDLICICSNCHRMIHRVRDEILTPEELKDLIRDRN